MNKTDLKKITSMQAIFNQLPGAAVIFVLDEKGFRMTYLSEGCQKLTGYTSQETLDRCAINPFMDLHPDDVSKMKPKRPEKPGQAVSYTFRIKGKDGEYRWVVLSLTAMEVDGVTYFYGIYSDINEEKHEDATIEQLVNALPGGAAIYRLGESIETLYYSAGIPKMTGHTDEEYNKWLKHDLIINAVYELDRPSVFQAIEEAKLNGGKINVTFRIIHKDTSVSWLQLIARKIHEDHGMPVYYAVYTEPPEETAMYQSVVENANTAILVAQKKDRKILYANPAWMQMAKLDTYEKVTGENVKELLGDSGIFFTDEELNSLTRDYYQEFRKLNSQGRYLYILAKALVWNSVESYICYCTDETPLRESRQRMQELLDKIPGGVAIFQLEDGVLRLHYINDACYNIVGLTKKKIENNHIIHIDDSVFPEDLNVICQIIHEIEAGADDIDIHLRVKRHSLSYEWIRLVGAVVERKNGIITMYACFSEFEAIMQTQKDLISSQKTLDIALNTSKIQVWKYDPYQKIITDVGSFRGENELKIDFESIKDGILEYGRIDKRNLDKVQELFNKIPSTKVISTDIKITKKDNTGYLWKKVSFTPILDKNGKVMEEIGSAVDISDQKMIEQRYKNELQMRKKLLNDTFIYFQVNLTKRVLEEKRFMSKEVEKFEPPKKFTLTSWNKSISNYIEDDYKQECMELFSATKLEENYKMGITSVKIEKFRLNESISDSWCKAEATLMRRPETHDLIAMIYVSDIDEQYKKQLALNNVIEEETEFIGLMDVTSGKVRMLKSNQATLLNTKIVEYDFDSTWSDIMIPQLSEEDAEKYRTLTYKDIIADLKQNGDYSHILTIVNGENRPRRKKTRIFYLDERKKDLVMVCSDITETYEKELQKAEELRTALSQAKAANKAKSAFLSRISHDMRTPLNGILGLTRVLLEKKDLDNIQTELEQIKISGDYLLKVINDTLDVAKIENGKMELNPEVCDGRIVYQNIIDLIRPEFDQKKLKLEVKANGKYGTYLYMDIGRIEQLIMNVLNNAAKFTPEGGTITLLSDIYDETPQELWQRITVMDNGIGISEEFLPHLFEPFTQEDSKRTSRYTGTGLGMTISKQIVELMDGTITAKSEIGKGTEITFTLHIRKANAKQISKWKNRGNTVIETDMLIGKRILLCEDHPLNTQLAVMLLESKGMIVETAEDGQIGVDKFSMSEPYYYDAILMDIRMPVMDGLDATKEIRKMKREDSLNVPIVAVTANALSEDIEQTKKAGMNAHLSKPLEPKVMFETLNSIFKQKNN